MTLSSEEITRITTYLDATTPLPSYADFIFIFGTRLETPAHLAAEQFHAGLAPYIVLTGGNNRYTGINEAQAHRDILINSGVPAGKIIVEDQSTNTLENVTFALPLMEQKMLVNNMISILTICKWMHSRRALMTLKRHLPDGIRYYAKTYDPDGITRENWASKASKQIANVLKNYENIPKYLEKGDIAEITRDNDAYI